MQIAFTLQEFGHKLEENLVINSLHISRNKLEKIRLKVMLLAKKGILKNL
jgi:hypothetical protein